MIKHCRPLKSVRPRVPGPVISKTLMARLTRLSITCRPAAD